MTRRDPKELLAGDASLLARYEAVRRFARQVRASEYHVTGACDIRCKGCWFFEHDFDRATRDEKDLQALRLFIDRERRRGVNCAILIGGEPLLYMDRIAAYVERMEYVVLSTNGLRRLPREGFERVQVFISLFGGGPMDDELRGARPNGKRFAGLFETSLENYRDDPRVTFVFLMAEAAAGAIEGTVRRIAENGNRVTLGLYSPYDVRGPLVLSEGPRLLEEALRVKDLHPDVVLVTPYYLRSLVTGESHWGRFGYEACPSISIDHPAHRERLASGNRSLPLFNTYAPDLETVLFCCTSGHCEACRDSQAVWSWLMVSADRFMESRETLKEWIELAEGYWGQFVWSPVRPAGTRATVAGRSGD